MYRPDVSIHIRSDVLVKVGDLVQINSSAKGVVTAVDVPEEEVAAFVDKIKNIQALSNLISSSKTGVWSMQ